MLKTVGVSGQLTLGKRYAGKHFELEERASGELVLRPVRLVRESKTPEANATRTIAFRIAEVAQVVLPTREQRNRRTK